jgi:hypothetical protein
LGHIRPFCKADIPQTAQLHREVFDVPATGDIDDRYQTYFLRTFLSPSTSDLRPLVHEEDDGRITGFLGVVGRRFMIGRRRVSAALSSQFVVHKDARKKFVGVMLLRQFLMGPQDLSFADESNESSRKIWERLGGTIAAPYSLHWVAPLHPAKFLAAIGPERWKPFMKAAASFACLADAAFFSMCRRLFRDPSPALIAGRLSAQSVPELISNQTQYMLRPCYEVGELQRRIDGSTHTALLRRPAGDVAGWYIYHLAKNRIAEVLQVGCNPESAREVIAHLFADVVNKRAIAVSGRLEPHIAQALPLHFPILYRRLGTMLIHSKDLLILETIRSGNALLSRIDGEWAVRFQ